MKIAELTRLDYFRKRRRKTEKKQIHSFSHDVIRKNWKARQVNREQREFKHIEHFGIEKPSSTTQLPNRVPWPTIQQIDNFIVNGPGNRIHHTIIIRWSRRQCLPTGKHHGLYPRIAKLLRHEPVRQRELTFSDSRSDCKHNWTAERKRRKTLGENSRFEKQSNVVHCWFSLQVLASILSNVKEAGVESINIRRNGDQFDLRKFHLKSFSASKDFQTLSGSLNSSDSFPQSFEFSTSPSSITMTNHINAAGQLPTSSNKSETVENSGANSKSSSPLESDNEQEQSSTRIDTNSVASDYESKRRYSWELNSNDLAENPNQPENMTKNLIQHYFANKNLKVYTPKLGDYKDIVNKNEYWTFTQKFIANFTGFKERNQVFNSKSVASATPRILGDENWAPVREQLILNANKQKPVRIDLLMKQQDYRCADCGYRLTTSANNENLSSVTKMFRYCDYYSKYFCRCCHVKSTSYIPSYVIFNMDFKQSYYVCKKAKHFLDKIFYEPLITLEDLNPNAFKRNEVFYRVKKTRLKLYNCQRYINSCRFAYQLKEHLEKNFEYFLVSDTRVYSFDVLFKFKKTDYYEKLDEILNLIIDHILKCEICSQQAFICELCNKNDLLYPFNIDHVCKCPNCLTCFHTKCFKSPESCPKCMRKRTRTNHDTWLTIKSPKPKFS